MHVFYVFNLMGSNNLSVYEHLHNEDMNQVLHSQKFPDALFSPSSEEDITFQYLSSQIFLPVVELQIKVIKQ